MPNTEQDELVEAVARAICTAAEQNGGPPWDYYDKHVKAAKLDEAEALLKVASPIIERALLAEVASMLRSIPGESEALHRLGLLAKEKRNLDLSGEG